MKRVADGSKPSMRALTGQAKKRLLELLGSPDDGVALLAAIEILDRAEGRENPRVVLDPNELATPTITVKSRLH